MENSGLEWVDGYFVTMDTAMQREKEEKDHGKIMVRLNSF